MLLRKTQKENRERGTAVMSYRQLKALSVALSTDLMERVALNIYGFLLLFPSYFNYFKIIIGPFIFMVKVDIPLLFQIKTT